MLQEQSYYPFGLQMAGISDRALGKLDSKNKFNGGSDFEEDYGVNLYYTDTRKYDPQIGRFLGVDELSELSSGLAVYHFAGNNPAMLNDPSGRRNQPPPDPGSPAWDFASSQILNGLQMGTYMDQWLEESQAFWGHFNSGGGSGVGSYSNNGNEYDLSRTEIGQVADYFRQENDDGNLFNFSPFSAEEGLPQSQGEAENRGLWASNDDMNLGPDPNLQDGDGKLIGGPYDGQDFNDIKEAHNLNNDISKEVFDNYDATNWDYGKLTNLVSELRDDAEASQIFASAFGAGGTVIDWARQSGELFSGKGALLIPGALIALEGVQKSLDADELENVLHNYYSLHSTNISDGVGIYEISTTISWPNNNYGSSTTITNYYYDIQTNTYLGNATLK